VEEPTIKSSAVAVGRHHKIEAAFTGKVDNTIYAILLHIRANVLYHTN